MHYVFRRICTINTILSLKKIKVCVFVMEVQLVFMRSEINVKYYMQKRELASVLHLGQFSLPVPAIMLLAVPLP